MSFDKLKKVFGPGILFASTAIGVSHLVQSTRAGANFGFVMVFFILAANIFKYPFFEFGSRYANATGESLIDGYKKIGKGALWGYFVITVASMFFVTSAVGFVTVGFMDNLLGLSSLWPSFKLFPAILLFAFCVIILIVGNYRFLDNMIKVVGGVLLVSTLAAFILTIINGPAERLETFEAPKVTDESSILFIIALMGWMPTAVDLSTWNSLWTINKIKTSGYYPKLSETLKEFNIGYIISGGLSFLFLTMGAYLLYGTGVEMPSGAVGFSSKIISLYTTNIGEWSRIIIAASSFSIMFGTCIAVFDGYSRSLERSLELLFLSEEQAEKALDSNKFYNISLIVLSIGGFIIIALFLKHFKTLVDLATSISFVIAPLIAIANFILVTKYVKEEAKPPQWLRILSYLGVIFLTAFSLYYLYLKL